MSALPISLPLEDEENVEEILKKSNIVSKIKKQQVSRVDLARLQPGQWINDEIINFYGALLLGRSDRRKEEPTQTKEGNQEWNQHRKTPLNIHYHSSFFWTKLCLEGYEKGRLAKWSKEVRMCDRCWR